MERLGRRSYEFMAFRSSSPSSWSVPILGVLREAFEIPGQNARAMLFLTLLLLLPFCFLSVASDLAITPVVITAVSQLLNLQILESSASNLDDGVAKGTVGEILRKTCLLLGLEIVFLFCFCAVSLFSAIAVVRSSSTTYDLEEVGLKDLLSRICKISKRQLITWIYMTFFTVLLVGFILILVGVLSVTVTVVAPIILGITVVIVGALFYLYLAAIWLLSMVISVVEEDLRDSRAFNNWNYIKEETIMIRRRLKASVLILLFSIASVGTVVILDLGFKALGRLDQRNDDDSSGEKHSLLQIEIMVFSCFCFLKLFFCLGYAVFYYEFKVKFGEEVEEVERRSYAPLPSSSRSPRTSTIIIISEQPTGACES